LSIDILKKQLKEGNFSNIYVFFGEEEFLKEYYFQQLKSKIVEEALKDFNYTVFEGKGNDMQLVQNTIEAFPVMSEHKMVVIKDSGILKSPKAEEKEFWKRVLSDVPPYVCLVFLEKEVDQRSKLFGMLKKQGVVVDFKYLKAADLVSWVNRAFMKYGKKINNEDIIYLLENCDVGMTVIKNEIDKVVHYCGSREIVTRSDIDAVISRSTESKVFDMIDAIMEKNNQYAFQLLNDMMILKEPVPKILTLLSRHFSNVLRTKLLLNQGIPAAGIASEMDIKPFVAKKYVNHAKHFSVEYLHNMLNECLAIDTEIKTGKADGWIALEMLIAKCLL